MSRSKAKAKEEGRQEQHMHSENRSERRWKWKKKGGSGMKWKRKGDRWVAGETDWVEMATRRWKPEVDMHGLDKPKHAEQKTVEWNDDDKTGNRNKTARAKRYTMRC